MAVYEYKGISTEGIHETGVFEAADPEQLYAAMKVQNIMVYSYKETKEKKKGVKLKAKDLTDYAHQMGTMLGSGITMTRALSILAQRELKEKRKKVYQDIQTLVGQGIPLSDAMELQKEVFPVIMINMVRAGESSGDMSEVFMKLSAHYEKDSKLSAKVKGAMMYPLFILVLTFVVVLVIFTVVLPSFFDMFKDMDTLPVITKGMIAFSKFMTNHGILTIIIAAIAILILIFIFKQPAIKRGRDRIVLYIPVVGRLMAIIYTARFARNLSSLYASGLSMIQSLQICEGLIGNSYIEEQFDEMIIQVRNGVSLSQAIVRVKGFDMKLASSIYVGEETGRIDEILTKSADSYDYEADNATAKLTTIIEPVMICLMAVIIGIVMLSVIVPIYQYYQELAG